MRLVTLYIALFLLCSFQRKSYCQQIPPDLQRGENLKKLLSRAMESKDDANFKLLVEYASSVDCKGQWDLLYIVSTLLVPPHYARQIFDLLLTSNDEEIIANALDELAENYPYICREKEIKIVGQLVSSKSKKLSDTAKVTLRTIADQKNKNTDRYPIARQTKLKYIKESGIKGDRHLFLHAFDQRDACPFYSHRPEKMPVPFIHEFTAASGKTYVGQSGNISERLAQHVASGKLLPGSAVSTTEILGGKTVREIAEQLRINELGGIENLENIRNPIGQARQYLLPSDP